MKRILIVDDSELIRQSLEKVFCRYPVEVFLAADGNSAIAESHAHFYDLCLLDICLPDIDGMEVIRHIKSLSPATKIAIMTVPPINVDHAGFMMMEADYFIEKPFELSEIKTLADLLFDGKTVV
ncbi:MAG TPA: response regulator [Dissulfurispiraceae bacterium]|nr:response regulator [Dissulfurispiraceae bacterium]